jgi:hypothetical protein
MTIPVAVACLLAAWVGYVLALAVLADKYRLALAVLADKYREANLMLEVARMTLRAAERHEAAALERLRAIPPRETLDRDRA